MRACKLLSSLALLVLTCAAEDCLPWEQGGKPTGGEAEQASRKYLRNAARQFPSDAEWHARTGQLLFEGQCYDLALSELLRARRLGAGGADLLLRLASVENILGAFADAAEDAETAATLPGPPGQRASAAALAGVAYQALGKPDLAIARFRRSLELVPDLENSALMLADLLTRKEQRSEAALVLQTFVARKPDAIEAWAMLGRLYAALNDPARSLASWNRVRRLNAGYPMADSMIAQAMLAGTNPNLEEVLRVIQRAKLQSSEDAELFAAEGKALMQLGRHAEAVHAFENAIRIRPRQANFYYQLGQAYQKLGRPDLAKRQFEIMTHLRTTPEGR